MRDAALMIASQGDDYATSLATRLWQGALGLAALVRRRWIARRHLRQLRRLDDRLLADIGLAPEDLGGPTGENALDVTRRLAARAAARRAEERWTRV